MAEFGRKWRESALKAQAGMCYNSTREKIHRITAQKGVRRIAALRREIGPGTAARQKENEKTDIFSGGGGSDDPFLNGFNS